LGSSSSSLFLDFILPKEKRQSLQNLAYCCIARHTEQKLGQQYYCQILKMKKMKKFILLGIILMNGMLISCSNDDDQDQILYQQDKEFYGTGGEDGGSPPPPPLP